MNIEIKTDRFVYQISGNGKNIGMIDRVSGRNIAQADTSVAGINKNGIEYSVSAIRRDGID